MGARKAAGAGIRHSPRADGNLENIPQDGAADGHAGRRRGDGLDKPVFFETTDDALAAFLELAGCRRTGMGQNVSARVTVTHVFDDAAGRLAHLLTAWRSGEGDRVSAREFARTMRQLRSLRLDEKRRLRRQMEAALAVLNEESEDVDP